jgi:polysaccharide pyruvyl transferase WcaK-like protein
VGDEAILTVMLEQLRQAIPGVELTVFTRNVEHTRANHQVERMIDARESLRDELVAEVEPLRRRGRAVPAPASHRAAGVGVEREITVTAGPPRLLEGGAASAGVMERQDVGHAHRVIAEMGLPDRARVLTGCYGPREMLGIVGRLDMAIGMRLHFLIFAALSGVPMLGLPYASKMSSVLQQLGLAAPDQIQPEHAGTRAAHGIDRRRARDSERGPCPR